MTSPWRGTATLVGLARRRDRVRLVIWLAAVGLLLLAGGQELTGVFATAQQRQVRANLMGQPSGIFMGGPGYGLDDYTVGAMMANEYTLFLVVAVAIMALQLTVRHTRGEEAAGRVELVLSARVGRHAPPTAASLLLVGSAALMSAVCALALLTLDLPAEDCWAWGLGIGAQMLVFGAVGLLCAQLSTTPRGALGLGLAVLGVAAVVRGVGDIVQLHGSWLSWFSPIAWSMQTRAFVDLRWWPLLPCLALGAVLLAAAMLLQARRDLDAGLLPQRPGRPGARAWLRGPLTLGWRLTRVSTVTWLVALVLLAVTYGSLAPSLRDSFADLPGSFQAMMGGADRAVQGFLDLALAVMACGAGALAVSLVARLRGEETAARTELVLSHPLRRSRWLLSWWLLAGAVSAVVLLLSALTLAATTSAVIPLEGLSADLVAAWASYVPALALLCSGTALAYAISPRLTGLGWLPVVFVLVTAVLGPLLNLPEWLVELSPFAHVARLADGTGPDAGYVTATAVLALAAAAGAAVIFRRRDVPGR